MASVYDKHPLRFEKDEKLKCEFSQWFRAATNVQQAAPRNSARKRAKNDCSEHSQQELTQNRPFSGLPDIETPQTSRPSILMCFSEMPIFPGLFERRPYCH